MDTVTANSQNAEYTVKGVKMIQDQNADLVF